MGKEYSDSTAKEYRGPWNGTAGLTVSVF